MAAEPPQASPVSQAHATYTHGQDAGDLAARARAGPRAARGAAGGVAAGRTESAAVQTEGANVALAQHDAGVDAAAGAGRAGQQHLRLRGLFSMSETQAADAGQVLLQRHLQPQAHLHGLSQPRPQDGI